MTAITNNFFRLLAILCCLAFALANAAEPIQNLQTKSGQAGKRIALVIGNDSYRNVTVLQNARADAQAIARALEAAGFKVTLRLDAGEKAMKEAVRTFKTQVSGGDEAIFYYSGHGVQLGSANYLLPIDVAGQNEDQVKDDAVSLQRVLDDLQEQKAKFSLAIVDACRNNPFRNKSGRSIGGRGLVPTTAATGQMILFSAGSGQEALDKLGKNDTSSNGLFTRVFLKEMEKPGVPVDRVLRSVRDEVVRLARSVGHDQVPALYDQVVGDFYFRPGKAQSDAVASPAVRLRTDAEMEQELWDSIKDSQNAAILQEYLAQYPNGRYVAQAKVLIVKFRTAAQPATQAAMVSSSRPIASTATFAPAGHILKDCDACPEMVVIPAGSFQMGDSGQGDASPVHAVTIGRSFALGRTEVTQGQWRAIMGKDPDLRFKDCGETCPVENVSWNDAQEFIQKLNARTGKSYRLPTEAEWEYACRAGGRHKYCGSDSTDSVAWHEDNSGNKLHPAAAKQPNAWGLYDMSGNVFEMMDDCWHENYVGAPADGSAWKSGDCSKRVRRSGSWFYKPYWTDSACRFGESTTSRYSFIGFRVAMTLQ